MDQLYKKKIGNYKKKLYLYIRLLLFLLNIVEFLTEENKEKGKIRNSIRIEMVVFFLALNCIKVAFQMEPKRSLDTKVTLVGCYHN